MMGFMCALHSSITWSRLFWAASSASGKGGSPDVASSRWVVVRCATRLMLIRSISSCADREAKISGGGNRKPVDLGI
jgi:hypothetical protein